MFEKEAAEVSDAVREGSLTGSYCYDWRFDLSHGDAGKVITSAITAFIRVKLATVEAMIAEGKGTT